MQFNTNINNSQQTVIMGARNYFSGMPVEYSIPDHADVVFVSDYYVSDTVGGAELTTQALIDMQTATNADLRTFVMHSSSLTLPMLDRLIQKKKHLVFGNFSLINPNVFIEVIRAAVDKKLSYSVLEYDFKFCKYRSPLLHFKANNGARECDCVGSDHSVFIEAFYKNAENMFWMSQKQRDIYCELFPSLSVISSGNVGTTVLSSVFSETQINKLSSLREKYKDPSSRNNKVAILSSGTWIKGLEESKKYCVDHGYEIELLLPTTDNNRFLEQLAHCSALCFLPLDWDTCPRLVIEAKLLGCKLLINENVLHAKEDWFGLSGAAPIANDQKNAQEEDGSALLISENNCKSVEKYLFSRPALFWDKISKSLENTKQEC